MSSSMDPTDNPKAPGTGREAISTGAAADSSDTDDRFKNLPRLLRYAMLVSASMPHIDRRLAAEIDTLCPNLALNTGWLVNREEEVRPALGTDLGLMLAAELDRLAVGEDRSDLRSLADCVRLLSLPALCNASHFDDHRRVAKSLLFSFHKFEHTNEDDDLASEIEQICLGWAALPCCSHLISSHAHSAVNAAIMLGASMVENTIEAAKNSVWKVIEERAERQKKEKQAQDQIDDAGAQVDEAAIPSVPDHHLVVASIAADQMKDSKLKEIIGPLKTVINTALPLVKPPPLHQVRSALMFEFPYAIDVIDFALTDLVGRTTVRLRPLLLVGDPGGGKSRFARRLGEVLGLSVWRTDASHSDSAIFGGTDKRWYSAEPCHPFLAVSQGKIANPMVLLDELEKAATRADYGRLWDCLLGFLEPETNCRYPDPALQINLNLGEVSYVATANSLDPLPSPLRDRFRVMIFPKPTAKDLDALLPAVIADLARERNLDTAWVTPLDGQERDAIARHWRGGSVRRLRRLVEAILRERDLRAPRN